MRNEGHLAVWDTMSCVQSLDQLGRSWDMKDSSAEILFQSFLQETLVSSFSTS